MDHCKSAKIKIRLGGEPILATIDTVAEVTVVDRHLWDRLSLRQADGDPNL